MKNKTALITGASRGLGAEIAKQFWQQGASLVLVARSLDKLVEIKNQLTVEGGHQQIHIIECDLCDEKSLAHLQKQLEPFSIDILVNNAAIQGPIGPVWENDWAAWQSTIQIDLLAPIALCRALLPRMIQRNYGKIINLSGGGATGARPRFSAYAVAKAGLVRFSETLAEEVKEYAISVNCIAPGVMNTAMLAEILQAGTDVVGAKEFAQVTAKQKEGDAVIIRAAELCVFLASASSDGISGKLISALWDPWNELPNYIDDLANSDIYTLRRIIPKDRGKTWGDTL